jgi:formate dehydrogenase (coenzyme F420) alpha subunit
LGAFDTYRTLAFLAAITGNIGINGGGCNFMHNTWPGGLNLPPIKGSTPKKDVALPVGPEYFPESILTGKPYQLKAIVTQGRRETPCCKEGGKYQQGKRTLKLLKLSRRKKLPASYHCNPGV